MEIEVVHVFYPLLTFPQVSVCFAFIMELKKTKEEKKTTKTCFDKHGPNTAKKKHAISKYYSNKARRSLEVVLLSHLCNRKCRINTSLLYQDSSWSWRCPPQSFVKPSRCLCQIGRESPMTQAWRWCGTA